tara:strand:+ start:191 stop:346 length:156 start_codon:yes stop_codon:yes gene_type:complete
MDERLQLRRNIAAAKKRLANIQMQKDLQAEKEDRNNARYERQHNNSLKYPL